MDEQQCVIYRHLNHSSREFRLVTILPEPTYQNPVVCELHKSSLDESPQYSALSYAWADYGMGQQSILLDQQAFSVTTRLNFALQRLRSPYERRTFWIDAICINQRDDVEKSHQVGQMKGIYENAREVLVYLGDGPDVCFAVVQLLESLARESKNPEYLRDRQQQSAYIAKNLATLFPDAEAWEDLFMFFIDEWWKRAWIVQEVVVAKQVTFLFGKAAITWDKVEQAMDLLRSIENYNISPTTSPEERSINKSHVWYRRLEMSLAYYPFNLFEMRQSFAQHQRIPLLQILVDNRARQSSDPRDKVFAFLGLAKDVRESLKPDYTKNVQQIYKELVKDIILRQQDLEVLRYAALAPTSSDLPSWCPDWRTAEWRADFLTLPQIQPTSCSASKTSAPLVTFSGDFDVLNAKGFIVDAIEAVSAGHTGLSSELENEIHSPIASLANHPENRPNFSKFFNLLDQTDTNATFPFKDQFFSPLVQTLDLWVERLKTKNVTVLDKSYPSPVHMSNKARPLENEDKTRINHSIESKSPKIEDDDPLEGDSWKHVLTAMSTGLLKPFRTTRGGFGFAIPRTQDGDVICRLLGSTNLFILRIVLDHWEMVGQCTILQAPQDLVTEPSSDSINDVSLELVEFSIH